MAALTLNSITSVTLPGPFGLFLVILGGLIGSAAVWIAVDYTRVLRLRAKMPPGPFPYPVVGNVGRVPARKPWIAFERWSQEYKSPIVTIWTGNSPTVIVNDCWTASDLMEKRANIYSSRPHMVLVGDMLDETENNQTTMVYGDTWRLHRKIMHSAVGSQAVRTYRQFQANESRVLALDALERPHDYVNSIERYSCSVVTIIGWGRRVDTANDPLAQMAIAFVQMGANLAAPAQHLVEAYPWLVHLPSCIYPLPSILQREGQKLMKYFYALSYEGANAREDNFAKRLLREQAEHGLSYKEISTLTGNLIGGGVDTSTTTIVIFIFAMCAFPEVQRRAQEELDRALPDRSRYPDWSEVDSLPYLSALVNEVFRWRSAIVLGGPPHAPVADDMYNGYLIPKGTTVIGNLWAIHRNPRDYPNPDEFRPERWFNEAERRPLPTKKGVYTFGWGRRICSGQPLAEQGIAFTIAEFLWAFNMRSVDDKGHDLKPDIFAFDDNAASRPLPFKVDFAPRSEKITEVIRAEAARARKELEIYAGETKISVEDF